MQHTKEQMVYDMPAYVEQHLEPILSIINKNRKKKTKGWPECREPTHPYSREGLGKMNLRVT